MQVDTGGGFHNIFLVPDAPEMFGVEPEDGATDPLIADQQIGAQAEHINRHVVFGASKRRILEFFSRARLDVPPRRPANAIPGVRRKGLVLLHDLIETGKGVSGGNAH